MPHTIKRKKGSVNIHKHAKKEIFKTEDKLSARGLKHVRVCPNCGHGEFKVENSILSWLFGQKSKCMKCSFVFKKAFTEKESQRKGRFSRKR